MTRHQNAIFEELLTHCRVVPVLRRLGTARSLDIARAALSVGIRVIEVTLQSADDAETLAEVVRWGQSVGVTVGAGTVVTAHDAMTAARAGAAFAISPGLHSAVITECREEGLPLMPGVATATEVATAREAGFVWLKAFPATSLGTEWLRAMNGPFPDVAFVATGGITAANAASYLDAGAHAVGVGSSLMEFGALDTLGSLAQGSHR